jgi:hypothetical protein
MSFYRSRYVVPPIVYLQDEGSWKSVAPSGEGTVHEGHIPSWMMGDLEEISGDEAKELLARVSEEASRTDSGHRRLGLGAVLGCLALAVPLLLFLLTDWGWVGAAIRSVAGPLVFTLVSKERPDWGYGVVFSLVPAVMAATGLVILARVAPADSDFHLARLGALVLLALSGFVVAFLAGMVGASLASLLWLFIDQMVNTAGPRQVRSWQLGIGVTIVVMFAILVVAVAR